MPDKARRTFLCLATAAALASVDRAGVAGAKSLRAIAFDGFTVFDPTPVFSLLKKLEPGKGDELVKLWRARQFEYTWLQSLTGVYVDFPQITSDSLSFAETALGVRLSDDSRREIMDQYFRLPTWPEASESLRSLRETGIRLALLSNMTSRMLESCVNNAALTGVFEALLSIEPVKLYKPAPKAYGIGVHSLRLEKDRILFVASAGWDASGAKTFGYPTYWVNRQGQPQEWMGSAADGVGSTLTDLETWIVHRGLAGKPPG